MSSGRQLYLYRFRDTTDDVDVHVWSYAQPTKSPRGDGHTIDTSSFAVIDSFQLDDNANPAGAVGQLASSITSTSAAAGAAIGDLVGGRAGPSGMSTGASFMLAGTVPPSTRRDIVAGNVTHNGQVHVLTSVARLETVEVCPRGALAREVSVAVQPGASVAGLTAKWGMFNSSDGLYFERKNNSLFLCVLNGGVAIEIEQALFSDDRLDGLGPSGLILKDLEEAGAIYGIRTPMLGLGDAEFFVMLDNARWTLHRHAYTGTTRLPLVVTTSGTGSINIGDRRLTAYGELAGPARTISGTIEDLTVSKEIWWPAGSVRRISSDLLDVSAELFELDVLSLRLTRLRIIQGTTLVNADFAAPDGYVAGQDTVCEYENTATSREGGIIIWEGMVEDGYASGIRARNQITLPEPIQLLPGVTYTVEVKSTRQSGDVTLMMRWREIW